MKFSRCHWRRASTGWVCALIAVGCIGCSNSSRTRLVGTWVCDQRLAQLPRQENVPGLIRREADDDGAESGSLRLRFYRSGKLQTETRQGSIASEKTGTWEWISFDQDRRVAVIECRLLNQSTEHVVTFIDDRAIRMIPPNLAGLPDEYTFYRAD